MGSLNLPSAGAIYVDTQILIYTVQRHPKYLPLLAPLWSSLASGAIHVVLSELALMEVLVAPIRQANAALITDYEVFVRLPGIELKAIDRATLYEAARYRASTTRLKTPDAIHPATCSLAGCHMYLTNDRGLQNILSVPTVVLDDLIP